MVPRLPWWCVAKFASYQCLDMFYQSSNNMADQGFDPRDRKSWEPLRLQFQSTYCWNCVYTFQLSMYFQVCVTLFWRTYLVSTRFDQTKVSFFGNLTLKLHAETIRGHSNNTWHSEGGGGSPKCHTYFFSILKPCYQCLGTWIFSSQGKIRPHKILSFHLI
jgi:hypothetical protein